MGKVDLEIHGRRYAIGCEDGQEAHIRMLAAQFASHVDGLARQVGEVGDNRLYLMAALMLADELYEVRKQASTPDQDAIAREVRRKTHRSDEELARSADLFEHAAQRLEQLAATIERA